jgi:hypothetical protein
MKPLNRQAEWRYMNKIVSQGPQYLMYAIGLCVIALATASGALDEKMPAPTAQISSHTVVVAGAAAQR